MGKMINKKLEIAFFLFLFLYFIPVVLGQGAPPVASWWGTVEIDGNTSTNGAVVEAFINNAVVANTTVGAYTSGYYLLNVPCTNGTAVTLKIYGVAVNQTGQVCSQGTSTQLNLWTNKTADDSSCTYAGGCTANYCYGGTCGTTTTTTPAAVTTTTPSSGGGGGGGGGAAVTVVTETKTVSSIGAGETGTFTYTKSATLGVQEIDMEVKNDVSNVQIKIEESSKPADATEVIGTEGKVYNYIKITKTNIGDADIDKAMIKFKVKKSWVKDNSIDSNTIALSRYADGKWNKLPTTKLPEDNDYYYYEAESPGLSVFAIIGEKVVSIETTTTQVTTIPTSVTTTPKPHISLGIELSTVQIVGAIIGIVVILTLVVFLFVRFQAVKMAT
jgi:PGF-pre-PGF domain-containing protein